MQDALAAYARRDQRGQAANIAATLVLLMVHGFLFTAIIGVLGLLVMGTDPCGAVKCGDPAWFDHAMALGIWGGAAIFIADFAVAIFLLIRRRMALYVPVIGCFAQVGLAIGAAAMASLAGPV